MNKTTNVYVISKGEYSDYAIVSVRSSKEEAEEFAAKLNGGMRYPDYEVETWPLDALLVGSDETNKVAGFRAIYDYKTHGWFVDETNVSFKEILTSWDVEVFHSSETTVSAAAKTKAECLNMLEAYALAELAKLEGNAS